MSILGILSDAVWWVAFVGCILAGIRCVRATARVDRMSKAYVDAIGAYTAVVVKELSAERWHEVFEEFHAIDDELKRKIFPEADRG